MEEVNCAVNWDQQ